MKQTLVIGSTVIDVILRVPQLPLRGGDINITSMEYRLGGCAYNIHKTLRRFDIPALLCSPAGTGLYGRMVRERLAAEGIAPLVNLEEENGCCYCLVEPDGERSFLSLHGAEYLFSRSWMEGLDYSCVDSIFICGIEVEDPTGSEIVDFVLEHPEPVLYFAPGPRIARIAPDRMERLLNRRPVLHLNETEARSYAGVLAGGAEPGVERAAEILAERTGNTVVITLGKRGCYYRAGGGAAGAGYVPGFPASIRDTVGAGDVHCGAFMASRKQGNSPRAACETANRTAAAALSS
ncbi:MAG: PfkB family carbohydrate kinase [Treponema sp.]|jgi:sugar/nucleoside kinase (ribokinase family)|nr:PfkB family carbohydrate kinase [Treponema sp.]